MTLATPDPKVDTPLLISWEEDGEMKQARFASESQHKAPSKVTVVDDRITADTAFRLASEGRAMLWRGDFQNARQLLNALARRTDRKPPRTPASPDEAFLFFRQAKAQRARTLGMLLIEVGADFTIELRRAPDVRLALSQALGGAAPGTTVISLRELLGMVGAHEWRRTGVEVKALGARIHPHYGVFAPIRNEYLDLVRRASMHPVEVAFDIGTGTGVIAALLARRGVKRVIATEIDPRAVLCARENLRALGLFDQVLVEQCDLYPPGRADLVVCNPPWLPARPSSALEHAIYDPDSRMLLGFLNGALAHLNAGGEAWLILSDLAERLTLRSREWLLAAFFDAGLELMERLDTRPTHAKSKAGEDPLAFARKDEVTSLWRLRQIDQ